MPPPKLVSPLGLTRPPSPAVLNKWFINQPTRGSQPMIRLGNDVTAYIDPADYYNAAATAISDTQPGGYVVLSAWVFGGNTPVVVNGIPDQIGKVLAQAGSRGVTVQVLLSGHLRNENTAVRDWFNTKPGCSSILDDRLRVTGSFHQKALVVSTPNGPAAFVGGMDFAAERLRTATRGPWHDVQVRITGGAAHDILDVLADRWDSMDSWHSRRKVKRPTGAATARSALRAVQVVRTYGNPTHGHLLTALRPSSIIQSAMLEHLAPWANPFRFAPHGDSSIHDLLVHAIRAATETIYIEDQYFVLSDPINGKNELLDALADTISKDSFKHLIVLTCNVGTINSELCQVNRARRTLWAHIASKHPDKVSVWAYTADDHIFWEHSKTWIFDDTFALVGSANFNRRSLTNDGELGIGIYDAEPSAASNWVKNLRIALWLKHLAAPGRVVTRDQVADFGIGVAQWIEDPTSHRSVLTKLDLVRGNPYNVDQLIKCGSPLPLPEGIGHIAQFILCNVGPWIPYQYQTAAAQWEVIDPDGT